MKLQLPARIPQLYYGTTRSYQQTSAERKADLLYGILVVFSEFLFLILALVGYLVYELYGLLIFGVVGYLLGMLIRRSLGMRGRKVTTGYFKRMRERAGGAKPGLLEGWLERMSRDEITPGKARSVAQAYENAVNRLRQAQTPEEQNRILADLDRKVNEIITSRRKK